MDKKSLLSDYIMNDIMHNRHAELDENQDLIGTGVLDSLRILQLVSFLEESFGIEIPDEDVVYDNFQSLGAIVNYLNQYP